MIVADVLTITFIHIGFLLALPAFWLLTQALFPTHAERMVARYRERPVASFFAGLGLGIGALLFIIALGAAPVPLLKGVALLVGAAAVGYGLMGAGALAALLGSRMPSAIDRDQPWRAIVRGGGALALCFILPVLGWLLILPIAVISGVGVNALALFGGRKPQAAPQIHPEMKVEAAKPEPAAMAGAGTV